MNSRKKAPAFQFYAADWLTDSSLRMVSAEARGVWIDLLCHSFLSSSPGYLAINGHFLDPKGIQKLSGISQKRFKKVFDELTTFGVLKMDEKGRYFCKRMVEDARLSKVRAESGRKGGNPNLVKQKSSKTQANDKQTGKQKTTPSSSTSISIKKKEYKKESEDHLLQKYVRDNCPEILKLKSQLTFRDCERLEADFGNEKTIDIFNRMENFRNLKKYKSAYLTARNWLKKENNEGTINKDFEQRLREF